MPAQDDDVASKVAEWQRTIDEIRKELDRANEAMRAGGVDPQKFSAAARALLSPKQKTELSGVMAQDRAAVEGEVEAARARMGLPGPAPRAGRKLRSMV